MDFMGLNGHEMGYEWNIGRISWDLAVGNLLSNGFCGSDSELGVSYSLQKRGAKELRIEFPKHMIVQNIYGIYIVEFNGISMGSNGILMEQYWDLMGFTFW